MTKTPFVSVVVPNYNGREHLEYCLPSLLKQAFPPDRFEILVVDNGSTDSSRELVSALAPRVKLVPSEVNRGFSGGINLGAENAQGDLLAFLNNDAKVEAGWLSSLCRTLEEGGEKVAAVAGKLLNWDGTQLDFGRGLLAFDGHAFQQDFGLDSGVEAYTEVEETLMACGGNMLIRKSTFQEIGGFDDEYFAYFEDVDLGWRLWSAGHRVLFDPGAVAYHRSAGTSGKMDLYDRAFLFERNAFWTVVKNLDDEYFPRAFPAILLTLLNRTFKLVENVADEENVLAKYKLKDRTFKLVSSSNNGNNILARYPYTPEGYRRDREGPSANHDTILTVSHPHGISQLRALHYILEHLDTLLEKRARVQEKRVVPDRAIFERFPPHLVPTYHGDQELFSSQFFRWLLSMEYKETTLDEINNS